MMQPGRMRAERLPDPPRNGASVKQETDKNARRFGTAGHRSRSVVLSSRNLYQASRGASVHDQVLPGDMPRLVTREEKDGVGHVLRTTGHA
jgi:hypothetical protein